jgi:hypothetical protein
MSEEALTIKEFVIQWGQKGMYDKKLAADLNALLRNEHKKFAEWYLKNEGYPITDSEIDKFIKSQQQ